MAIEFTDSNFPTDVEQSKGVVLIDFWAPWCGPCKMQGPIVEDIAKDFSSNANVKIGKINVDENPNVSQQFQVFSIPTIIIFKDGKPVDQAIGLQSKASILSKLNRQVGA
jgi:thioredoxin 1